MILPISYYFHKGNNLNSSHRSSNIGNYIRDNRMGVKTLMGRNCLINQDEFLFFLFNF